MSYIILPILLLFATGVYLDFFVDCEFHENGQSESHTSFRGLSKFLSYIPRSLFHLSDVLYKKPSSIRLQHLIFRENRSREDFMCSRA